LSESAPLI